jgi:hypothetical protein
VWASVLAGVLAVTGAGVASYIGSTISNHGAAQNLTQQLEDRHAVALIGPGPDFDRGYAMTTDLTEPVIVAMLHSQEDDRDYPLLIDGTHRLYRAHAEGTPELPVYVLNVEETLAIREGGRYS